MEHAAALDLVNRLAERCTPCSINSINCPAGEGRREAQAGGVPEGLYSSLKFSIKKNGVARAMADVCRDKNKKHCCRSSVVFLSS